MFWLNEAYGRKWKWKGKITETFVWHRFQDQLIQWFSSYFAFDFSFIGLLKRDLYKFCARNKKNTKKYLIMLINFIFRPRFILYLFIVDKFLMSKDYCKEWMKGIEKKERERNRFLIMVSNYECKFPIIFIASCKFIQFILNLLLLFFFSLLRILFIFFFFHFSADERI